MAVSRFPTGVNLSHCSMSLRTCSELRNDGKLECTQWRTLGTLFTRSSGMSPRNCRKRKNERSEEVSVPIDE